MTNLFLLFLSGSISVGLVTVVLFALTPFLNKRYAAKWKYWIWLFLAVRLLLPISGADVRTARQTQLGTKTQLTVQTAQDNNTTAVSADTPRMERMTVEIPAQMTMPITGHTPNGGMQITLLSVVVMLWAAGALGFLSVHLLSYMRYKRQFIKMGTIIEDSRFWHQLQELKQELGIKRSVLPVASADAASPMMLGFFHAVIVLPDEDYSAEELYLGEAQKELQDKGYAVVGDRMFRQDGDMIYSVELKEAETDTWGVFSSYPVDAQEGWGVQIHAIADTFTASEAGNF